MRKQLTPEEQAIIRETIRQGEEEAAKNPDPKKGRPQVIKSLVVLTVVFFLFAFLAYMLMIIVGK